MTPALDMQIRATGETTDSGSRDSTSLPDGFIHRASATPEAAKWMDMIMPMEFEKWYSDQSQVDSFAKMMWSLHHIMRNDARRRYAHGLSFQDTKARLWFINRSDVLASREFDVNKDWKCLVRIILSMLVATPVELGYDPDIEVVSPNDGNSEPSYDITIRNSDAGTTNTYRTIGIISDAGADSMVGPGTRVWEVQKLAEGVLIGPSYALKDAWIYEDCIGEHVVLKKIRKEQPGYAQHFLTPIDHAFVPVDPTIPSILDNTHKTLGRQRNLRRTNKALSTRFGFASVTRIPNIGDECQNTPSSSRDRDESSGFILDPLWEGYFDFGRLSKHARKHYRIVFREIGTPVHDLHKFADVFIATQGGWEGLHAMHLSGYVHRDVSAGNILLVGRHGNKRGVIMDLEYAKAVDDTSGSKDEKTGTSKFMATEVAFTNHHRLGTLRASLRPIPTLKELLASSRPCELCPSLPPPPSFRHNPLHDMESVWWLCVWMMFDSGLSGGKSEEQLRNYHRVFGSQYEKQRFSEFMFHESLSHLSEVPDFASIIKSWLTALDYYYSDCYGKQDSSTNPPTILRVDAQTIQLSYRYGRKCLRELEKASGSLCTGVTQPSRKSPRRILDCVLMPPRKKRR
ncbi:hypothetical protein FRC11_014008, partial [Ceratobasidium sp. 423]